MTRIFVPREQLASETRVAATPETVKKMVREGLEVTVQEGAGRRAHFPDERYSAAGASLVDAASGWSGAGVVLKVGPLTNNAELDRHEAELAPEGGLLVGLLEPYRSLETLRTLSRRGVSALSMELIPRITRAQSMDALSSQASIAGYKAVLLAAGRLGRYFPLLMTAAGTIQPARVVVMGAGVAGLQAVATAKRLGAIVEVSDIRPEVQEQVESLGGRFIELPGAESGTGEGGYAREMGEDFLVRQRAIVQEHLSHAEVAITTALVPGRPAPTLLTREMVEGMRPGSVVVDLAVAQGGNCELSRADEEVAHRDVLILAPSNLPASMPSDASTVYSRNLHALLELLVEDGELQQLDLEDEIVAAALVTHGGEIVHPEIRERTREVPT